VSHLHLIAIARPSISRGLLALAAPIPTYNHTSLLLQTPLEPVRVPPGCYPIEVVQFWRGERAPGYPLPLNWSILVRTSEDYGDWHELVGDTYTYAMDTRFEVPLEGLEQREDWRGSHVVGYVAPYRAHHLWRRMRGTPVVRHDWTWNTQNWVCDALQGMWDRDMYVDVNLTLASMQTQMCCILEAWELGEL